VLRRLVGGAREGNWRPICDLSDGSFGSLQLVHHTAVGIPRLTSTRVGLTQPSSTWAMPLRTRREQFYRVVWRNYH
jgi:hypothetical protein